MSWKLRTTDIRRHLSSVDTGGQAGWKPQLLPYPNQWILKQISPALNDLNYFRHSDARAAKPWRTLLPVVVLVVSRVATVELLLGPVEIIGGL
jgi:hypothetical protein